MLNTLGIAFYFFNSVQSNIQTRHSAWDEGTNLLPNFSEAKQILPFAVLTSQEKNW